jgi:hypothetical protein
VVTQHTDATVLLSCDGIGRVTARVDVREAADIAPGQSLVATVAPADVHLTEPDR